MNIQIMMLNVVFGDSPTLQPIDLKGHRINNSFIPLKYPFCYFSPIFLLSHFCNCLIISHLAIKYQL